MNEEQIKAIVDARIMAVLGDVGALPYEVGEAIKNRLGNFSLVVSAKDPTTDREQIDDNLGVHYAQAVADGYLEIDVAGSTYYLPAYFT